MVQTLKKPILTLGLGLVLALTSTLASACPWCGVVAGSIGRSRGDVAYEVFPVLYVIDRFTGKEQRIQLSGAKLTTAAVRGFSCAVEPPADNDLTDTYRVTCAKAAGVDKSLLVHSCKSEQAMVPVQFNGVDGHGMTLVTAYLGCEPAPEPEDGRM